MWTPPDTAAFFARQAGAGLQQLVNKLDKPNQIIYQPPIHWRVHFWKKDPKNNQQNI